MQTRRDFLKTALLSTSPALLTPKAQAQKANRPLTGLATPDFRLMDEKVSNWLRETEKPGGVLVIAHQGRLIYARGFGYADVKAQREFTPTTPFRYGSVAKWFTAMCFMRLVEKGMLNLDFSISTCKPLLSMLTQEVRNDANLPDLTYRNLLSHKSGLKYTKHFQNDWCRIKGGKLVGLDEWVRFGLSEGFKWKPGTQTEYTNFNYILAHFLQEKLSGQPYDLFIQNEIFKRAGVSGISLAGMREPDRLPDESQYYVIGDPKWKSIWPEDNGKEVGAAYNTDLRTAAGAGGYRGSALALLRLMTEFAWDGRKPPLKRESVFEMIDGKALQNPPCHTQGMGLAAGSDFKNSYWWGTGGMTPGMSTTITRRADSTVYVFAFNSNNDLDPGNGPLNDLVLHTLDEIRGKPQADFWSRFPTT